MSNLVKYINSLPDGSFATVQKHFTARNVIVKEEGPRYLLFPNIHKEQTYALETPEFQQAMEEAVGTILTKDTNTICCFGFPKTTEVSALSPPPVSSKEEGHFIVSKYTPGTLIRAYWTESAGWKISTSCVMNAYDSYWASQKSFGDLVAESLGGEHFSKATALVPQLRQHCSYQFILQPADEKNTPPVLHHIGTYDNEQHKYVSQLLLSPYIVAALPPVVCNTFDNILELLATKPHEYAHGVIFFPPSSEQTPRYKMLTGAFNVRRALIGNTPDLHLRYLECCAEGTESLLLQEYPHVVPYATAVKKAMNKVIVEVHEAYVKRFIKRDDMTMADLNYYYKPIVSTLHKQYRQTRQKINYQTVQNAMWASHPRRILFILKGSMNLL